MFGIKDNRWRVINSINTNENLSPGLLGVFNFYGGKDKFENRSIAIVRGCRTDRFNGNNIFIITVKGGTSVVFVSAKISKNNCNPN
jgi:hypothetical protein